MQNTKKNSDLVYPASSMQIQFWTVQQLNPKSPALNVPAVFHIKGAFDLESFQEALDILVANNSILRTLFKIQGSHLVQICLPNHKCKVDVVDLKSFGEENKDVDTESLIFDEISEPFALENAPPMRVKVIHCESDEFYLIITVHHIISDLRTKQILSEELSDIYNRLINGKETNENKNEQQYGDFAVWQAHWLQTDEARRMVQNWKDKLNNKNQTINLQSDRMHPSIRTLNGGGYSFRLSEKLTSGLKILSKKYNADLFLTMLSGYATLLHRYCQQDDLIIGVPLTNRRLEAHKDAMGCFVNILPVCIQFDDKQSFSQILKQVRFEMLHAHRNQEVPFETIVNAVKAPRNLDRNPIFQAGFTYEPPMALRLDGNSVESYPMHPGGSQLDLFLIIWQLDNTVHGCIEYNSDIFDQASIERLATNFTILLESLSENGEEVIEKLPIVGHDELKRLLWTWNDTRVDFPNFDALQLLFEKQVLLDPGATALQFGQNILSYQEMNCLSNRVASLLRERGIGPDSIVGVLMERSVEMVIGVYGILKAGGAYLPLDPDFPDKRLALIAEDAGLTTLLTQNHLEEKASCISADIITLDPSWQTIDAYCDASPECISDPSDLAYVIYTSGSTGKPKGVMIEHRGIINRILWMQEKYKLDGSDTILQKTPFTFDVSVWELFWAMAVGAKLVIAPPNGHRDTKVLIDLIKRQQITTLHFVPSMLRLFLDDGDCATCESLKRVICSGEALPVDLKDRFFEKFPSVELHNLYGPTEAAVDVTYWKCLKNENRTSVPIGKPIANTTLYILDKLLQPLPIGVSGELHIGGIQVARGYINRPELTALKFIDDPFSKEPGARLYKTGDLARYLPDGTIEYLGRMDSQVKINGLRIELGEVENVICEHPGVKAAVALTRELRSGNRQIVAFVVIDQENAGDLSETESAKRNYYPEDKELYALPNGVLIHQMNKAETDFMYKEIFQDQVYLKHGITIHDDICVFDVGANIGLFSILIANKCSNASIYAFEPVPHTYGTLQKNAAFYENTIKTFDFGISDQNAIREFTFYPNVTILSGSHAEKNDEMRVVKEYIMSDFSGHSDNNLNEKYIDELLSDRLVGETFECRICTLSEVIRSQKISRIDLLKIDVEKSELEVLRGIQTDDWQKIMQIVIEIHGGKENVDEIRSILERQGYRAMVDYAGGNARHKLAMLYARRSEMIESGMPEENYNSERSFRYSRVEPVQFLETIKAYAKDYLPNYMVPSVFVPIDKIPLLPNGKVNRKELAEMKYELFPTEKKYISPQTDIEDKIAGIWKEMLGADQVSTDDSFFDIGGTSIMCIQMMDQIQKIVTKPISVVKLFQYPTIEKLAAFLSSDRDDYSDNEGPVQRFSKRKDSLKKLTHKRRK